MDLSALTDITVSQPTLGSIVAIVLALLLLLCSGFVSASEIAFFSLSPVDLSEVEEEHHRSDTKILKLRGESERLLATILIANNLVNVAIIMLLNYFFMQTVQFGDARWLEFLCLTVILTFLLLLFGEVVPKLSGNQRTLSFCRFAAPALAVLVKFCSPLSYILIRSKVVTEPSVCAIVAEQFVRDKEQDGETDADGRQCDDCF